MFCFNYSKTIIVSCLCHFPIKTPYWSFVPRGSGMNFHPHILPMPSLQIAKYWMLPIPCVSVMQHCINYCVASFLRLPPVKEKDAICNPVVMSVLSVCNWNALQKAYRPHRPAAVVQPVAMPHDVTSFY